MNTQVVFISVNKGVAMNSITKKRESKIDRTFVVVDLENLCGGAKGIGAHQREVGVALREIVGDGAVSYVVATGPFARAGTPNLPFDWPGARWLVGHGVDGADTELMDVILREPAAVQSKRVIIASGDHQFATALHFLACEGVDTTVVSRKAALSRENQLAAHRVVTIPDFAKISYLPKEAA